MKKLIVSEAIERWINSMCGRGLSTKTISNRRTWLFFFTRPYGEKVLIDCDRWMINELVGKLSIRVDNREISKLTLYHYNSTLKRFFSWCLAEEMIEVDPTTDVVAKRPKTKKVSKSMKICTYQALRRAVSNDRDRVLFEVILAGLRPSETINLRVKDIDLMTGVAIVSGKVGERPVVFDKTTVAAIREWLVTREFDSPFVFVHLRGKNKGKKLNLTSLRLIFRRLARRAGAEDDPYRSPKAVRHLTGRLMREAGDILDAKEFLGHEDVATTEIYTPTTSHRVRELAESNNRVLRGQE